ncbi:MAG: M1 family metallopeptidase [Chloroflexi bacterium]|nr:M1 family metallopeptidase [Chloroflexota bacterium]
MKVWRWLFIPLLVIAFSVMSAPAWAQTPPQYSIDAYLDWENATLNAQETLLFTNNTPDPLSSVVFQVHSAAYGGFTLYDARVNDIKVIPQQENTVLEVPLPQILARGKSATIALTFQLQIPHQGGRYGVAERIITLGNWYPVLAPYRGPRLALAGAPEGWARYPHTEMGDPFFTQVADYKVALTTSSAATVAHTGNLVSHQENTWNLEAQGVRDFALAISPRYQIQSRLVAGVEVTAYYLPEHTAAGEAYLEAAEDMLLWMADYLEPYPYPSLAIAEMSTPSTSIVGQEYPQLVFISSATSQQSGSKGSYLNYLILHEIAHQWFYSLVGNDQVYEPWLDEALATWLPLHWARTQYPYLFAGWWQSVVSRPLASAREIYDDRPVDSSIYDFANEDHYFAIVYRRGAQFWEEVYQTMGEESLQRALKDYLRLFGGNITTSPALLDLLQSHTEANLNPIIRRFFTYTRYQAVEPLRVELVNPIDPWSGTVPIIVFANSPIIEVKALVDDELLAIGNEKLTLDSRQLSPGQHLLTLVVRDLQGRRAERAYLVNVSPTYPSPTATPSPSIAKVSDGVSPGRTNSYSPWGYALLGGLVLTTLVTWVFLTATKEARNGLF